MIQRASVSPASARGWWRKCAVRTICAVDGEVLVAKISSRQAEGLARRRFGAAQGPINNRLAESPVAQRNSKGPLGRSIVLHALRS